MALDFELQDVMHRIITKYYPAYLPTAKKKYVMRAVYQPELDIHGIASKAEVYNITTPAKVIEEGLGAGMELMFYLAADGYKIKTPVFTLKITVPGEYDGTETHLPEGIEPEGRLNLSSELRKYLGDRVKVQIDGIDEQDGFISEIVNDLGEVDFSINGGALFTVRGVGLKIEADEEHRDVTGIFLEDAETGERKRIRVYDVALNTSKELRAIGPSGMFSGKECYVVVCTQSSARGSGNLLKNVREVKSDVAVLVQ
jgi:hypothetical protein